MGWDNLYEASYKGVVFQVTGLNDELAKVIVKNEYPHRPGADLEDLGRRPRSGTLRGIFFDEDYPATFNALLAKIDEDGSGDFIHPIFGPMTASIEVARIRHSPDAENAATVDLNFIEDSTEPATFAVSIDTPAALRTQAEELDTTGQAAAAEVLDTLVAAAAEDPGTLAKIQTTLNAAVDYAHDVLRKISNGAMTVSRTVIDYTTEPDLWGTEISTTVSRVASAVETVITAPRQIYENTDQAMEDIERSFREGRDLVLAALESYEDGEGTYSGGDVDLEAYTVLRERHAVALLTKAVELLQENEEDETFHTDDIDAIVTQARTRALQTINLSRAVFGIESTDVVRNLKDLSAALLTIADKLRIARHPLINHEVKSPVSAMLLAHHLYEDYEREDEILRLNPGIRNPNDIGAGRVLRVYAT